MDRRFGIILVALVAIFGVYFIFSGKKDTSSGSSSSTASVSSHSEGLNAKNVEIVEYGDFQCPACGSFHPLVKQVVEKYKADIKFTFKNFPLDSIHPNARSAHRAAEAAGKQGKFFEMFDLLYSNQSSWVNSSNSKVIFEDYATQLSLNLDSFRTDYASEETNTTINADTNEGKALGVSGTPTYFINGRKLDNNDIRSVELLSAIVDAEISKQNPTTSAN